MERREDRCLRSDTGRVDPDVVAPAIVRTICILIATNPLPVIFVPCELVRGNPIIGTALVDRSRVPAVAVHEAGTNIRMRDGVLVDVSHVW